MWIRLNFFGVFFLCGISFLITVLFSFSTYCSISLHREELPACHPDEHELCHLGPFDDEHPATLQLPGAHEPSISRHGQVRVRLCGVCRHRDLETSLCHIYERAVTKIKLLASLLGSLQWLEAIFLPTHMWD